MEAILVVDIGRHRCQTSYVEKGGSVVAHAENSYLTGKVGDWIEQEPRDWWLSLTIAFAELKEKAPEVVPVAIILSGQTREVLLMGSEDRLDAAIMPEDNRATLEWQFMVQQIGLENLLRSANIVHEATSPVAKLLWLKKHQSTKYESATTLFLGAHDYIAFKLCGARVTDYTTASATDLFSLQADTWAFDILQSLELRMDWLPTLVAPGEVVGQLNEDAASRMGLPAGLPVMHGVADYIAAMVGAGSGESNQFTCYLGDSGWLGAMGVKELANPITGLYNLREPENVRLAVVGIMITAGGCFDWLRERFGSAEEKVFAEENLPLTELITTLAAEATPGSGGVIFLPYLSGEQAPFRDPDARGGWYHVSRKTWRSDLYRAVLEGVAYSMRAIQMLMQADDHEAGDGSTDDITLRLIGGEYCTPFWAQIFADVFDCKVDLLSPAEDVFARGAAYIAGKALGWYTEEQPSYEFVRSTGTFMPDPLNVEIYEKMFGVYCKLYPALYSSFNEMRQKEA